MSSLNAHQEIPSNAAPVTPNGSMFLSNPSVVDVTAHQELDTDVQPEYLTPSNNASRSSRSSEMPLIPDTPTPTLREETFRAQRVLVSPPRARFHLAMRPLRRRAVRVEQADWILDLRMPSFYREGRYTSTSATSFLPIQEPHRTVAKTGASMEPSLTEPSLPFLARRDTSRRSIQETETFPKTHEYPIPPSTVFFPQF